MTTMTLNNVTKTTNNHNNRPNKVVSFLMGFATIAVLISIFVWASYNDTHYSTVAEVYMIEDSETIFVDGAGYLWSALDTEYKKGEFVELYFDNNCTDYTRKDDKIVKIKRLDN